MIEYDDRDQIPTFLLRSGAKIRRRPGAPCQLRWLAGSKHGRTISLDDIGGIESRAHQSPAERFRVEEARTVADEMTHEGARTIMRRIAMDYDRLAKLAEEQLADQEAIGRKT
jgi:hypothetical protein